MKMQYTKPMLYAESLELTEHITQCSMLNSALHDDVTVATCGFALNGRDANGNPVDGPILFQEGLEGSPCTDPGDPDLLSMRCYNYFVDNGTMFQS